MACLLPNTVKYLQILPYGQASSIAPDTMLDFFFPKGGFLDLYSLLMYYDLTMSTSGTCAWPRDGESVIQRLEVFVNGKQINCIDNYQQIFRILADFGYFSVENSVDRYTMRNALLNGNPSAQSATSVNGTYYARNWLGFFNEHGVIDTSKNDIHMRITLSPRQIICSGATTDTWSLSNVYLTCTYYERYDGDLPSSIKYSDFKSVLQYNPTTTQETFLKLFTKNIDYVVGTILRTTNKTITTGLTSNINNTRFFARNGTLTDFSTWNFKVNQRPIYNYAPKTTEFLESMLSLFPRGFRDVVLNVLSTTNITADCFAVGGKVGFINNDPEEVEVSFTTTQGSTSIANNSLLFAKLDNELSLN
jgi:hypothetical protein